MKNKKVTLLLLSSIACVGVCTAAVIALGQNDSYSINAELEPGAVTISASNPNVKMDQGSGYAVYSSALKNSFTFYYEDIELSNGKYVLSGGLYNTTAMHGIYQITIDSPKSQSVEISYGRKNTGENGDHYDLDEGSNVLSFASESPAYMSFHPHDDPFEFTSITFRYTCVAPIDEEEITEMKSTGVAGFNFYEDALFANEGTTLNEIDLETVIFETKTTMHSIVMDKLSDLEINYNEPALAESTTVVSGIHSISISFKQDGWRYYSDDITLIGFENIDTSVNSIYLDSSEFHIQSNDDLPKDFTATVSFNVSFIDSDHNVVYSTRAGIGGISVTSEMIVEQDEHPFSVYGEHTIRLQFQGVSNTVQYFVYDPSYCNIRTFYLINTYEVPAGRTKAEFLDDIKDFDFYISYYEYDSSLPQSTKLTESNFPTLTDDSFNGSSTSVGLDVVYDTFVGKVYFQVQLGRGNLIKTYTSDTPVIIGGGYINCVAIKIYDNGIAELLESGEETGFLCQYDKDGTTLTISFYGTPFKYTVDDVNNTFTDYQSSAEVLREIKVDFSALGGGSTLYDATQYDDNTITFYIEGMTFNCNYTEDTSDAHIIYFVFSGMNCVGTFNADYSVLTVTFAQA